MIFRDCDGNPLPSCWADYATLMPQSAADASGGGVKMGYGQGGETSVTLSDLSRLLRRDQVSDLINGSGL
jgi:hypothetical protein